MLTIDEQTEGRVLDDLPVEHNDKVMPFAL